MAIASIRIVGDDGNRPEIANHAKGLSISQFTGELPSACTRVSWMFLQLHDIMKVNSSVV